MHIKMVKRQKVLVYRKIVSEEKGQQLALEREEKANQQMTAKDRVHQVKWVAGGTTQVGKEV